MICSVNWLLYLCIAFYFRILLLFVFSVWSACSSFVHLCLTFFVVVVQYCVCMYVRGSRNEHAWLYCPYGDGLVCSVFLSPCWRVWGGGLTITWSSVFDQAGWPATPKDPPFSASASQPLWGQVAAPRFLCFTSFLWRVLRVELRSS